MNTILIIGGGSIGKRHLKNILDLGMQDISVVEVDDSRRKSIEKEFSVATFSSVQEAFVDKEFSIAFICSPSVFHLENALLCAKKGCDLFIEKPLSHSIEGLEQLFAVVKEKKLITMVGSNWKFYPLFQKMKEILDSNVLGKVLSARCQFGQYLPDWHPYEDYSKGYSSNKKLGGGILLDSHEFDYLTWFLGDVKKLACFADTVSDLEIDVEDVAEVILQFKSGVIAEIHLDYLQRVYQRNFEFFCERGSMFWSMADKKVTLFEIEKEKKEFFIEDTYDLNIMYIEEIKHFFSCLEKRKETITSITQGKKIIDLISASKESSTKEKVMHIT
jgi:predicted dehydrogenase